MQKFPVIILLLIVFSMPAVARVHEAFELRGGFDLEILSLLNEDGLLGGRLEGGYSNEWFYVGASASYRYRSARDDYQLRLGGYCGLRFDPYRHPIWFETLLGVNYFSGPWGYLASGDADAAPPHDIFTISLVPSANIRLADWLFLKLELPIHMPLARERWTDSGHREPLSRTWFNLVITAGF